MDDATQKLVDRVRAYLDAREAVVPEIGGERFDIIHDIDLGSRGHSRLRASDVRSLADALEAAQRPPVSPEVREELDELIADVLIAERDEWPRDPGDAPSEVLAGAVTDAILARFSFPSQQHVGDWDADRAEYVCSCGSALNAWWPDGMTVSGGESAFDKWMRLHPALPSQPVYDEGKIARWLMREFGVSNGTQAWMEFQGSASSFAAALVAALRSGELTREETNR